MHRLRLKYEKKGPIRFASHRDLMRVFRRALASAEIPVSFSQGFNPHPRLSFGPSLRTGWESEAEYIDLLLDAPTDDVAPRCNRHLPDGLRIAESKPVEGSVRKLAADITGGRYEIFVSSVDVFEPGAGRPKPLLDGVSQRTEEATSGWKRRVLDAFTTGVVARFGAQTRPGGDRPEPDDGAPAIIEFRSEEADREKDTPVRIEYFSTMHGGKSLFPEDVLTPFLGEPANYTTPIRVVRRALFVERVGKYVSPMSRAALETNR